MTENTTAAVTAEQYARHEQSHREAELYDHPGARTAKGCDPIGYLTVLQFTDGQYDLSSADTAGLWLTPELAVREASHPDQVRGLNEGERWVPCAVVPIEDGRG